VGLAMFLLMPLFGLVVLEDRYQRSTSPRR
jgi:hypothetical protein